MKMKISMNARSFVIGKIHHEMSFYKDHECFILRLSFPDNESVPSFEEQKNALHELEDLKAIHIISHISIDKNIGGLEGYEIKVINDEILDLFKSIDKDIKSPLKQTFPVSYCFGNWMIIHKGRGAVILFEGKEIFMFPTRKNPYKCFLYLWKHRDRLIPYQEIAEFIFGNKDQRKNYVKNSDIRKIVEDNREKITSKNITSIRLTFDRGVQLHVTPLHLELPPIN
jgi:hypothetical protein